MRLSRDNLLQLMALADDELEGEAKARAEKLLGESQEARRVVDAMRAPHLGSWLGECMQARELGVDTIADDVMTRLRAAQAGPAPRLAAARPRHPTRTAAALAFAVSAMAIAAGVAVYVRSVESRSGAPVAVSSAGPLGVNVPSAQPTSLARADAPMNGGVEVNEIDSPLRGVSVFEIPVSAAVSAAGRSSVVIWIEDDPEVK